MRKETGKNLLRLLPSFFLWMIVSLLLWSWVFNLLTDTDRAHKITLYADMHVLKDRELAIRLEEDLPEGIRLVQVHSFDYALMDSVSLETADLYVMTAAQASEHADWLCSLPPEWASLPDGLVLEGAAVGLCLYSAGSEPAEKAVAASCFNYDEAPDQSWYLCFGRGGFHLQSLENGVDNAALPVVRRLLALE